MDGNALKNLLNITVQLRKKNDTSILKGFIKEVYIDSILFVTEGRLRIIDFSEIAEVREIDKHGMPPPPTTDFYYTGNGREESWK